MSKSIQSPWKVYQYTYGKPEVILGIFLADSKDNALAQAMIKHKVKRQELFAQEVAPKI